MKEKIVSIGDTSWRRLCAIAAHADVSDLTYIAIYFFVVAAWRVCKTIASPAALLQSRPIPLAVVLAVILGTIVLFGSK